MKLLVPFVLIAGGLIALVTMGIVQGGIPEIQVHELLSGDYSGRKVKVHGKIARIEKETRPLVFEVCDKLDASKVIRVEVDDVRPDLFKVGNDVAVEGALDGPLFNGTKIYTKCPSKYEASKEGAPANYEGKPETPKPATPQSSGPE